MASYQFKSGYHYVIFRYVDDNGNSRQCWKRFDSERIAKEDIKLYTFYENGDELSRRKLREIAKNKKLSIPNFSRAMKKQTVSLIPISLINTHTQLMQQYDS